jgi:hypothetical protein
MQQGNLMGNSDPNKACNLALCLIEQAWYVDAEGVLIDMLSGRYQAQDHEDGKITKCDNPPRKVLYYRLRPIHFGH